MCFIKHTYLLKFDRSEGPRPMIMFCSIYAWGGLEFVVYAIAGDWHTGGYASSNTVYSKVSGILYLDQSVKRLMH